MPQTVKKLNGRLGSDPRVGKILDKNGYPLWYSGLEVILWTEESEWATLGVIKSDMTEYIFTFPYHTKASSGTPW